MVWGVLTYANSSSLPLRTLDITDLYSSIQRKAYDYVAGFNGHTYTKKIKYYIHNSTEDLTGTSK